MHQGELRAEFAHKRIRDVHPTGSGSAVRVSIEPDPDIRRWSLAILKALNWHGVAMVEFRKPAHGPAVFMEVNGRFWHSLPLAIYAALQVPGGEAMVLRLAAISVLLSLLALVASELIARRGGRGLHVL